MDFDPFENDGLLSIHDDDTQVGDYPTEGPIQPNVKRRRPRKAGELIPYFFLAFFIFFIFSSFFQDFLIMQTKLMGPQLTLASSIVVTVVIYCYNKFYNPILAIS